MLAASMLPISTTGYSTSPVTSSSRPGSGLTFSPSAEASRSRSAAIIVAAAIRVEHDMGRFELFEVIGRVIDRDVALGQKAVSARRPADRHAVERQRNTSPS